MIYAKDGREAIERFSPAEVDLIVLDLMLPYIDGFEVAERIRKVSPQIPILMLTARGAPRDRVRGLEAGADDYLTKPFHLEEFLLRVRGMLRRKSWYRELTEIDRVYASGDIRIDFGDLTGRSGSKSFTLTPLEAALLRYLMSHANRAVPREELLEQVWGIRSSVETRTVENFVVRIRKHLEHDPSHPVHIRTVRGVGYMFSTSDEPEP